MKYPHQVPQYLFDRPHNFVTHCMKKLQEKCSVQVSVVSPGVFTVDDGPTGKNTVVLGDLHTMPECTCYEWLKTYFPCPHFFAVFNNFEGWKWDSLSSLYRNSPFLTLDDMSGDDGVMDSMNFELDAIKHTSIEQTDSGAVTNLVSLDVQYDDNVVQCRTDVAIQEKQPVTDIESLTHIEIASQQKNETQSIAWLCRELLTHINKLTYKHDENCDALRKVHLQLSKTSKILSKTCNTFKISEPDSEHQCKKRKKKY